MQKKKTQETTEIERTKDDSTISYAIVHIIIDESNLLKELFLASRTWRFLNNIVSLISEKTTYFFVQVKVSNRAFIRVTKVIVIDGWNTTN